MPPWPKGKSGNPGGRPHGKLAAYIRKQSQDGQEFVERMIQIARGETLYVQERMTAKGEVFEEDVRPTPSLMYEANLYLFERLEGKIANVHEVNGQVEHTHDVTAMEEYREMTPEQRATIVAASRALREHRLKRESALAAQDVAVLRGAQVVDSTARELPPAPATDANGLLGRASTQGDPVLAPIVSSEVTAEGQEDADPPAEDDPFGGD